MMQRKNYGPQGGNIALCNAAERAGILAYSLMQSTYCTLSSMQKMCKMQKKFSKMYPVKTKIWLAWIFLKSKFSFSPPSQEGDEKLWLFIEQLS